jgi:hypothetical protein
MIGALIDFLLLHDQSARIAEYPLFKKRHIPGNITEAIFSKLPLFPKERI